MRWLFSVIADIGWADASNARPAAAKREKGEAKSLAKETALKKASPG